MKKSLIKNLISIILFISICGALLIGLTNIMRNAEDDRERITGIKSEDDISVLYVGGSSAFVYFEPLKAYKDYGFKSYVYGTNSLQPDGMQYLIDEALKYQNPDLLVIDARIFYKWNEDFYETGLRNVSDSMDVLSLNRIKYINNYFNNHDSEGENIFDYYFDIAKYHNNYYTLTDKYNQKYVLNEGYSEYKGFLFVGAYDYRETPDNQTTECSSLNENCERELNNLLDYLEKNNLQALFVISPKDYDKNEQTYYNEIGRIVTERGFDYLNSNNYYEEMGVDFSNDFYNHAHMNCYGAEKYTKFLSNYICSNYSITRDKDPVWDIVYERFIKSEAEYKEAIDWQKSLYEERLNKAQIIANVNSIDELQNYFSDSEYYFFIFDSNNTLKETPAIANGQYLNNLSSTVSGTISRLNNIASYYTMSLNDSAAEISIYNDITGPDGAEKHTLNANKLSVVVFDVRLGKVVLEKSF